MTNDNQKVRWGVLGTANFGRTILPAMQRCQFAEVSAVASRSLESAKAYAKELAIPKAYGSYEEILRDTEVDAIYIPLPNHMHIGPAKLALEAGKHVLCEKPISVNAEDALELLEFSKNSHDSKLLKLSCTAIIRSGFKQKNGSPKERLGH